MTRICATLLLALSAVTVHAQDWPAQRPITLVSGFGPGVMDNLARIASEGLSKVLGQAIVLEYRVGAGGNIAAQRVMRSAADGYTLLIAPTSFVINPSLFASAGYDPHEDFVPVVLLASVANVIAANPTVPAEHLDAVIRLARQQPLSYASAGIGTVTHLTMERLKSAAGVDLTHVPFLPRQAMNAVLGGHTSLICISIALAHPHVQAGKIRALAITATERSPLLPGTRTLEEQGFNGFDDLNWFGLFAPANTPGDITERLNREVNRIFAEPEVKERLHRLGVETRPKPQREFADFLRAETAKWAQAVRKAGARVD